MLGRATVAEAERRGFEVVACDSDEIDITNADATAEGIEAAGAGLVINAAAFTFVDRCESERATAFSVNGDGAGNVARACAAGGRRLLHVSTDYVFDGAATQPIPEDAEPAPLSVYGSSKLAGENQVLAAGGGALVVRTSALFGDGGPNFVDTIAARVRRGGAPLRVVADQTTAPTYAPFLARALLDLGESGERGVVHYRNREPLSWFDFARAIVAEVAPGTPVHPATSSEVVRPARRPAYSVLAVGKFESIVGREVEAWLEGLRPHLAGAIKEKQ